MKLLLIRERKEKMKEIYRMTREEILQNQHVSEKGLTESRVQEIRQKNRLILSRHFHHHMQKYFVMVKK